MNQLRIFGAVADWCEELAQRFLDCPLTSAVRLTAKDQSESPPVVSTSTNPLLTDFQVRGNLLHQYKQKFANLPVEIRVIKTCSEAGFTKTVSQGRYFVTIHDVEMAKLGCPGLCRDYTLPRDDMSRPKRWIRGNTKIGPALEVTVTYHQGRYGIDIRIYSLLNNGSQCWVAINRRKNKYLTAMPEGYENPVTATTHAHVQGDLLQQKSLPSSAQIVIPLNLRKWIDINREGTFDEHRR